MVQIGLRNLKGISRLDFDVPGPGVWIVTGLNGSGKTSLFAALYRIDARHAFQRFYRTNALESRVDSFARASVEYTINGSKVVYRYGGQRWRATPKSLSGLLAKSPYPSVQFIEASGERIEPFADEISPRRMHDAAPEMRDFMTEVLGESKWQNLRFVNTRRGRGSDAYLIPYRALGAQHYFSERSFSLGELCVLKLAKKLTSVRDQSMLLVDEVEMALHPQAQVRLLRVMERIAKEKGLTVLFSTHSATLIKNIDRRRLILLHNEGKGRVDAIVGAYPAQVLGEIAFTEELNADFVFYVEDEEARLMLEQLAQLYVADAAGAGIRQPLYKVLPVGGYREVMKMVNNSSTVVPPHVKRFAFLDKDAEANVATPPQNVKFLPCTPELGLTDHLETLLSQGSADVGDFNRCIDGCRFNIGSTVASSAYRSLNKTNLRARAKDKMDLLVAEASALTLQDVTHIRRRLYGVYCAQQFAGNIGSVKALLGPVFNSV